MFLEGLGELIVEYPIYIGLIIFWIIIFIADSRYQDYRAHRVGELSISDVKHKQEEWRLDSVRRAERERLVSADVRMSEAYFEKESTSNGMSRIDWDGVIFGYQSARARHPEFQQYEIEWNAEFDDASLKAYLPPLAGIVSGKHVKAMVGRCNQLMERHITAVSFGDRRPSEQTDLFWKLHRVESFFVPRLELFFKDVKRKNNPYHTVFRNFGKRYREASLDIQYDRNTKSGPYAAHRCVGFLLEHTSTPHHQKHLYLFNWMIETLAWHKSISHAAALEELSGVLNSYHP